jgi:UDP-N-acetylglucosamine diphosphorylase/glucosamine-1-phosphate N-acetyltransferase
MNYILFDDYSWDNLLPLTFTRPVSEIRIGILRIREKWERYLDESCYHLTRDYLSDKYPLKTQEENVLLNSSVLPDDKLVAQVQNLDPGQALVYQDEIIAARLTKYQVDDFRNKEVRDIEVEEYSHEILKINHPWEIFLYNGKAIEQDFKLLTANRTSQPLSNTNQLLGENEVFIEPGASVEGAVINSTQGPVYIGQDAEIMEGSVVRGPFAMAEHAVLKLSAKIYGPTTLGPYSKAGGELNNAILTGYSNKAHDGFLGNAVLGEWCNIGAGSNNSNLKNNYASVKLWDYTEERFIDTQQQFCGLIMGDHSKCAINTMFNTGTVVGVNANIYGAGFPRNFIPSFSWGGSQGFKEYRVDKALEVARKVMKRRNLELDETQERILREVFNRTQKYRRF